MHSRPQYWEMSWWVVGLCRAVWIGRGRARSAGHAAAALLGGMPVDRRRGQYLGTEIDEKWWERCTEEGLVARGSGEYWYDEGAFYFLRDLTGDPIVIPFDKMRDLKVGAWHLGRWAWGKPVIKFLWVHHGQSLSSGFILSNQKPHALRLLIDMRKRVPSAVSRSGAKRLAPAF